MRMPRGPFCRGRLLLPPNSHFFLFESRRGHQIVVKSGEEAADTGSLLTHFICLALSLLPMKRMEKHCIIKLHAQRRPVSRPPSRRGPLGSTVFPRLHAQKHPGGVASMTRDRGYPDWLVLSALLRLLWAGYISTKYICFGCVWLVAK